MRALQQQDDSLKAKQGLSQREGAQMSALVMPWVSKLAMVLDIFARHSNHALMAHSVPGLR